MNQRSPAPGASPGGRVALEEVRRHVGKPEVDPGYVPAAKRLESEKAVTLERGRLHGAKHDPGLGLRDPLPAISTSNEYSGGSSLPRKTISIGGTRGGSPGGRW